MAFYGPCIACQFGRHDSHVDVPRPVPPGVMGGHVCPCRGECRESRTGRLERQVAEVMKHYAPSVPEEEERNG